MSRLAKGFYNPIPYFVPHLAEKLKGLVLRPREVRRILESGTKYPRSTGKERKENAARSASLTPCRLFVLRKERTHVGRVATDKGYTIKLCSDKFFDAFRPMPGQIDADFRHDLRRSGMHGDRRIREYSSGMKRKLAIVSAFQADAPLLILDEPPEGTR